MSLILNLPDHPSLREMAGHYRYQKNYQLIFCQLETISTAEEYALVLKDLHLLMSTFRLCDKSIRASEKAVGCKSLRPIIAQFSPDLQ